MCIEFVLIAKYDRFYLWALYVWVYIYEKRTHNTEQKHTAQNTYNKIDRKMHIGEKKNSEVVLFYYNRLSIEDSGHATTKN